MLAFYKRVWKWIITVLKGLVHTPTPGTPATQSVEFLQSFFQQSGSYILPDCWKSMALEYITHTYGVGNPVGENLLEAVGLQWVEDMETSLSPLARNLLKNVPEWGEVFVSNAPSFGAPFEEVLYNTSFSLHKKGTRRTG